ncbi:IS701 family transposase [Kutzneria chonburiensis]|uniref:IS701 family transposase n=1 Tax=Kutzneria chonburiensis TaxID=1483604 RepID=A0ABV6MX34_9PSEU|nr:IS701 family transposase [Kutzneria chonburiensis]
MGAGSSAKKNRQVIRVLFDEAELVEFCRQVFASLARSDQRRYAEVYLRGLMHPTARKSMQRIAAEVAGTQSGQSLQQFVNQSPWDPQAVRSRAAGLVTDQAAAAAWVIDEVAFPKNGRFSAGVDRQYARPLGKVVNCQVGLTAALTSAEFSLPANWTLCLPESWDRDEKRRSRAHIPADERHRARWQHAVELVDDMSVDWGLPVAPIVCDISHCYDPGEFLAALDDRSLDYVVQVNSGCLVRASLTWQRPRMNTIPGQESGRVVPLTDVATMAERATRQTVTWVGGPDGQMFRSQFVVIPVGPVEAGPSPDAARRRRRLLVEWPLGKAHPRAFWFTNLVDRPIEELVSLAKLTWRARAGITELADGFGLYHYEGRSFLGWHHHVTLASAAYAFHLREQLRRRRPSSAPERSAQHELSAMPLPRRASPGPL